MPYINLKLYPGRSDEVKQEVARRIEQVVREVCKVADTASCPVVIEEVLPENWKAEVGPEIEAKSHLKYN